jgi:tripeptide aminopeptidase
MRGRAAHAGIRPEEGRSAILAAARAVAAMRLGRLDAETTANVGIIAGGTATNVVPERCRLEAEVRGLDDARVAEAVTEIVDNLHDAANAGECDLDVTVERLFRGYRSKPGAPQIVAATQAPGSAATSPTTSSPGAARTPTRCRPPGSRAPTSPTAPSTTTSPPSASASTPWRACSRSRSPSSTPPPR